jgi:TM2 domain-containing membrane protein YozV
MADLSTAFVARRRRRPIPSAAAVLGLIPGVGAMYNGQFFKGLIHVVIFAVLVSITEYHGIFGIFIAAWILYQSFEAFHTAKALRDGQPLPDPLG